MNISAGVASGRCPIDNMLAGVTGRAKISDGIDQGLTQLMPMRWGLVPWWWKKKAKEAPATFNARAETVAEKPMFRNWRYCV